MRSALFGTVVAAAIAAPALMSCDREPDNKAVQGMSYSPREPGSLATPTHQLSFQLLAADGPTRFAIFKQKMVESDKPCNAVTSAVLKGGLDGTDQWRISCADSGDWSIWIQSRGVIEVDRPL